MPTACSCACWALHVLSSFPSTKFLFLPWGILGILSSSWAKFLFILLSSFTMVITALFSNDPYKYHQQGIYGYILLLDWSPQVPKRIEGDTTPDIREGPMNTNEYNNLSKSKLLSIYIIIFYSCRLPFSLEGNSKHILLGAYVARRTHVMMLKTITSPVQPFYWMIDIPTLPVTGKLWPVNQIQNWISQLKKNVKSKTPQNWNIQTLWDTLKDQTCEL